MPEESTRIREGMEVRDASGTRVGKLDAIVDETATGTSRFLAIGGRLLPIEAVQGVEGGELRLAVAHEVFVAFPSRAGDAPPSVDEMQRAYDAMRLPGPQELDGLD